MQLALPAPEMQSVVVKMPVQATRDEQVVQMWLARRATNTRRNYARDVERLRSFANPRGLREITLGDLQTFADSLEDLTPRSQATVLSGVRSLFSFAQRLGYIQFNPAATVELPKYDKDLGKRILSEGEMLRIIEFETNPRNRTMIRMHYGLGCRSAELLGLRWEDLAECKGGFVVHISAEFATGGKSRDVLVGGRTGPSLWQALHGVRDRDEWLFPSPRRDGSLTQQAYCKAAIRAGITRPVSPH